MGDYIVEERLLLQAVFIMGEQTIREAIIMLKVDKRELSKKFSFQKGLFNI